MSNPGPGLPWPAEASDFIGSMSDIAWVCGVYSRGSIFLHELNVQHTQASTKNSSQVGKIITENLIPNNF